MWVYIQSEPNLYTVGFYDPSGKWHADSDWSTKEAARDQVRVLNGGSQAPTVIVEQRQPRDYSGGMRW